MLELEAIKALVLIRTKAGGPASKGVGVEKAYSARSLTRPMKSIRKKMPKRTKKTLSRKTGKKGLAHRKLPLSQMVKGTRSQASKRRLPLMYHLSWRRLAKKHEPLSPVLRSSALRLRKPGVTSRKVLLRNRMRRKSKH